MIYLTFEFLNIHFEFNFVSQIMESSHISLPLMGTEVAHRFSSHWSNKNIVLENNGSTALRNRHFANGLVFASAPLWINNEDDIFEIRLDDVSRQWSGG